MSRSRHLMQGILFATIALLLTASLCHAEAESAEVEVAEDEQFVNHKRPQMQFQPRTPEVQAKIDAIKKRFQQSSQAAYKSYQKSLEQFNEHQRPSRASDGDDFDPVNFAFLQTGERITAGTSSLSSSSPSVVEINQPPSQQQHDTYMNQFMKIHRNIESEYIWTHGVSSPQSMTNQPVTTMNDNGHDDFKMNIGFIEQSSQQHQKLQQHMHHAITSRMAERVQQQLRNQMNNNDDNLMAESNFESQIAHQQQLQNQQQQQHLQQLRASSPVDPAQHIHEQQMRNAELHRMQQQRLEQEKQDQLSLLQAESQSRSITNGVNAADGFVSGVGDGIANAGRSVANAGKEFGSAVANSRTGQFLGKVGKAIGKAAAAKKTLVPRGPQDVEDCIACRHVWLLVEAVVGNSIYEEVIYDAFSDICMDAQQAPIFYPACQDMFDRIDDLIMDYIQGMTVNELCENNGVCR